MAPGVNQGGVREERQAESKEGEHLDVEAEPLNVRILHSLEETINQSVQAVKDAVVGAEVDDFGGNEQQQDSQKKPRKEPEKETEKGAEKEPETKSLLQSVEDTIAHSVQSVEETIVQSVQTVKEAVNAAAEAAAAPASSGDLKNKNDVTGRMARAPESSAPPRRSSGDPCKAARNAYDRCFNRWYSETYVKREAWKKEDCGAEWEEYQACFTKRLERTKIEQLVKKERDALMRQSE